MSANLIAFPMPAAKRAANAKVALTEQRVADFRPSHGTIYVNDAKMPGLSVRVTKAGVKSYVFTKKVNGKLLRITLGKCTAMRLDDARKAAGAYHGDLARGVDVAASRKAAKNAAAVKAQTLNDAYERYLTLKVRRPLTTEDYARTWRLYIPDSLKRKALIEIDQADVEKLKVLVAKRGERAANKTVGLIAAIMSKSGRWADNPARGVERFEERVRTRRLNADELARLWRTLDAAGGTLWADFFRILILTGARREALCSMRWQDLDLDSGIWIVPAVWSKNRREMALPLVKPAVDLLVQRQRGRGASQWVWPSDKAVVGHVVNPEKPWRAFLKEAGVTEHVSLHDVRRTLGSNLAKSGVAAATISKALGHVSPQSARAYVHLDVEPAREAIEKAFGGLHATRET